MHDHLTATDFDALRAGRELPRAALRHLDGCLVCRRAYGGAVAVPASRGVRPWLLGAAAALVAAVTIATPLRTVASGFLEVFEPHTVRFIPVTLSDMRELGRMPDLAGYGTSRELVHSRDANVSSARAASSLANFYVRVPTVGIAPPTADSAVEPFHVTSPSAQQFTFSAARARGTALAKHLALAPMPAGLDGSTLEVDIGSSVVSTYVSTARATPAYYGKTERRMQSEPGTSAAELREADVAPLVVAQMRAPKIFSTGVSTATLENYLLQQPGFPPRLAAAFRALGDPSTTLPIPIPVDKAYAQPVLVDGVIGVGIGDDTGLGAGVIWQNHGILYAVAGPLAAHDVLAIADSLR